MQQNAAVIGRIVGNYRVLRAVGSGSMGVVYEAVHTTLRRRAAVKLLHPEYSQDEEVIQRFFNEALAVNVVEHPGLVAVFESGRLDDGGTYIIMEYLEGTTLRSRCKEEGRLQETLVIHLGRQIAAALSAAHQKGIVHRDLKPDNVMLVPDPEVPGGQRTKVLDFGIAKVALQHQQGVRTKDGVVLGTPSYMPPEQWMSANMVDSRADVYALGVMLYEMLAGAFPFAALNINEWMAAHMYEPPRPLGEVVPATSASLVSLIHRMLEKPKAKRPGMDQVADDLLRLSRSHVASARHEIIEDATSLMSEERLAQLIGRDVLAQARVPLAPAPVVSAAVPVVSAPVPVRSVPVPVRSVPVPVVSAPAAPVWGRVRAVWDRVRAVWTRSPR